MDCAHFGLCGGCFCPPGSRPPPYAQELQTKEAQVRGLLAPFDVKEWRPIVSSPDEWRYRNKMEFAFAVWDDAMVLGLRQAGRFDRIIDLQQCGLVSESAEEILRKTREWARGKSLTGYHRRRHVGDLRYLVVREAKNTPDRMAVLLTTSAGAAKFDPAELEFLKPYTSTAFLGVTDSLSDLAITPDMRLLWGPGTILEKVLDRTYRISPYSFFQTNTRGTERLYGLLRDWGRSIGGTLIDLYCGSGGITLALAGDFERALGIDTNKSAIQDAKENAERNGLTNTEFVCEDALDCLVKLPGSKLAIQLSAMVVDPPRPGLHPKALQALLEMNPLNLAYVSCNPESLARDLQSLAPLYTIKSVQPVDLFPHTAHVETLCLMEHK